MTYQQAFHTCCRDGLNTPNLGFQYQAASAQLSSDQLSALARQLVGYVPGPGAPPAPSAAEIAAFPVSLRYFPVSGVGWAMSQTVYVGHEDRHAQSGRFGNYFTHLITAPGVVPNGTPRPVAMWGSPSWRTDAGPSDAESLGGLLPGSANESTARTLLSDLTRRAWLAAAFDWLNDVLSGTSRIVVLDDAHHAWAWIAALTLCLPRRISEQISFDTFTGEPDRSAAQICVADPATDRAVLSRRELTGELHVVDLRQTAPVPESLLGRAIAEGRRLTMTGPAEEELDLGGFATLLALQGSEPMILEATDLPVALATLVSWLEHGEPHSGDLDGLTGLINDTVYEEADLAAVPATTLATLWRAAEGPGRAMESVSTLALRLALIAPQLSREMPLPQVAGSAPPEVVGAAIGLLGREDVDPGAARDHLRLIDRLGLAGANSALDRRIGDAATGCLSDDGTLAWLRDLAGQSGGAAILEQAIRSVSATASFDKPVMTLLSDDRVEAVHRRLCGSGPDFPVTYAWAVVAGAHRPEDRRRSLDHALTLASTPVESESLIDALYGDRLRAEDLRAVLHALGAAGRQPAAWRIEDGWRMLEDEDPFSDDPEVRKLAGDLHAIDKSGGRRSIYLAIWLEQELRKQSTADWMTRVVQHRAQLNDTHLKALLRRQTHGVSTGALGSREHTDIVTVGVRSLGPVFMDAYWEELTWALRDGTHVDLAADVVYIWAADSMPRTVADDGLERLPRALGPWTADARVAIGQALGRAGGPPWVAWWDEWCEANPPAGVLGRQFAKVRSRRPRD